MNTKKITIWISGIVIIAVLAFLGYYFLLKDDTDNEIVTPTPPPASQGAMRTPEESLAYLDSVGDVKFPKESTEQVVPYTALPESLKFLVPDNMTATSTSKVFEDNSKGFGATFEYSGDTLTTYSYLRNLSIAQYDFIEGRRTDVAGILLIENPEYVFKIELLKDRQDPNTSVSIAAKSKVK